MRRLNLNSVGFAALGRTIIKNNRAQRPNKDKDITLFAPKKPWKDPVQASPELLQQIREKVTLSRTCLPERLEHTHKKRLLLWGIGMLLIATAFLYFNIHKWL